MRCFDAAALILVSSVSHLNQTLRWQPCIELKIQILPQIKTNSECAPERIRRCSMVAVVKTRKNKTNRKNNKNNYLLMLVHFVSLAELKCVQHFASFLPSTLLPAVDYLWKISLSGPILDAVSRVNMSRCLAKFAQPLLRTVSALLARWEIKRDTVNNNKLSYK